MRKAEPFNSSGFAALSVETILDGKKINFLVKSSN